MRIGIRLDTPYEMGYLNLFSKPLGLTRPWNAWIKGENPAHVF